MPMSTILRRFLCRVFMIVLSFGRPGLCHFPSRGALPQSDILSPSNCT